MAGICESDDFLSVTALEKNDRTELDEDESLGCDFGRELSVIVRWRGAFIVPITPRFPGRSMSDPNDGEPVGVELADDEGDESLDEGALGEVGRAEEVVFVLGLPTPTAAASVANGRDLGDVARASAPVEGGEDDNAKGELVGMGMLSD